MSGGLVRREIAAPLTPEQRRQKQVEQDKLRADAIGRGRAAPQDRILLSRYQSDLDIEAARKRALQPVQDLIAGAKSGIADAEKQQAAVKGRQRVLQEQALALQPAPQAGRQQCTRSRTKHRNIRIRVATIDDINAKYRCALEKAFIRELRRAAMRRSRP